MIDKKSMPLSIPARRGEPCRRTPRQKNLPEIRGTYASDPPHIFKLENLETFFNLIPKPTFDEVVFAQLANGKFNPVTITKLKAAKAILETYAEPDPLVVPQKFYDELAEAGYDMKRFIAATELPT